MSVVEAITMEICLCGCPSKRDFFLPNDRLLCLLFWDNDISRIGLLKVGVPKTWDDSQKNLGYIRNAGVKQFMSTYNRVKDLKGDELLWGDEIEYGVFRIDPETKKVRLSLRAKEVSIENSSSDQQEANFPSFP
jgi:hypothetical protein